MATTILLLVLSTMNGMESLFSSLFYSYTAALRMETKGGKKFIDDNALKKSIRNIANVTDVVEVLEATTLVQLNGQQAVVIIKGVSDNFIESDFYKNSIRIDTASLLNPIDHSYQAIMGINIGKFLQLNTGKSNTLEVFYPKSNVLPHGLNQHYKCKKLEVVGLFSIEHKLDSKYIVAPISFLESLTNGHNQRSYWEIVLKDKKRTAVTQKDIQKILPQQLKINNRYQQNERKSRAILIERLLVYFIFSLVLLLTSFHIFFMLCMLILEKKKDIVTLSSFGTTSDQVGKIFFYNGLLVSLEGTLYGLCTAFTLGFLQQKFQIVSFAKLRTTGLVPYPIEMHGYDFLYTTLLTISIGIFASLWPMKRAIALTKERT
ncbi:ABC transporter permease [Cardinium endosymbiont of Tipula unca]|uniref:ABC transporter permease n=1 Tax=Cardinium endosymbiont of Tipula unca TaxID=3066216 RepID=UPI0030CB2A20